MLFKLVVLRPKSNFFTAIFVKNKCNFLVQDSFGKNEYNFFGILVQQKLALLLIKIVAIGARVVNGRLVQVQTQKLIWSQYQAWKSPKVELGWDHISG